MVLVDILLWLLCSRLCRVLGHLATDRSRARRAVLASEIALLPFQQEVIAVTGTFQHSHASLVIIPYINDQLYSVLHLSLLNES